MKHFLEELLDLFSLSCSCFLLNDSFFEETALLFFASTIDFFFSDDEYRSTLCFSFKFFWSLLSLFCLTSFEFGWTFRFELVSFSCLLIWSFSILIAIISLIVLNFLLPTFIPFSSNVFKFAVELDRFINADFFGSIFLSSEILDGNNISFISLLFESISWTPKSYSPILNSIIGEFINLSAVGLFEGFLTKHLNMVFDNSSEYCFGNGGIMPFLIFCFSSSIDFASKGSWIAAIS